MQNLIVGNKVKIRKAIPEDAELLCRWYADGRVMVHVGFTNGFQENIDRLRQRLSSQISNSALFIIMTENDVPIGECNFNNLNDEKCNIGIKICELAYQGKGYGKDAICAFINYLFIIYSLKHIDLDTLLENTRAQSLYKKVGFKELHINKDCWVDPMGKSRSAIEMTLTREDFYNHAR